MSTCFRIASVLLCTVAAAPVAATVSYALKHPGDTLIGAVEKVRARHEDTLSDLARANGLGFQEIKLANPGVDSWLPGEGTEIVLPSWYVLPDPPMSASS